MILLQTTAAQVALKDNEKEKITATAAQPDPVHVNVVAEDASKGDASKDKGNVKAKKTSVLGAMFSSKSGKDAKDKDASGKDASQSTSGAGSSSGEKWVWS